MFFELVSFSFAVILVYGNEYITKGNKNWTSFKNFALKLNLTHNIYIFLSNLHVLHFTIAQDVRALDFLQVGHFRSFHIFTDSFSFIPIPEVMISN